MYLEGLHEGSYRILILGINGNPAADNATIHRINHISEVWLSFPDDLAPTREQVKLLVNGTRCTLYWKGENLSLMASTLGHVLTRSYGYVHLTFRAGGGLDLQGVDTITCGTRLYLSPSEWQEQAWVEA